ncbi:hypothetical protein Q3G72_021652 [Acer saccharum]|nr:hypothetical protein Q3G72_021652 [Acer saccharum]
MPTISVSNSLHFPANFLEKTETHLRRMNTFSLKSNRTVPSFLSLQEKNRIVSVSIYCTFGRNQEFKVDVKNRSGWIHFVGIGGCGLSALAMLTLKQGFEVSGSDIVWSSYMDGLKDAGARLYIGHSMSNIEGNNGSRLPIAVVVSSAIPQDNVEILHAKSVGVPVYKRDYWLAKLTENYNLIAVSGSHGKSTTASMLAYVFKAIGDDLTAVVGACVPQSFNLLARFCVAIVTNLDWEHVDIFQDEEAVNSAFRRFLKQIRAGGHLVLCGDRDKNNHVVATSPHERHVYIITPLLLNLVAWCDYVSISPLPASRKASNHCEVNLQVYSQFPEFYTLSWNLFRNHLNANWVPSAYGAYSLLDQIKQGTGSEYSIGSMSNPSSDVRGNSYRIVTYGISSNNEWHAKSICPNSQGGSDYILCSRGCPLADISLQIPGIHNVLNSLAVIATVLTLMGDKRDLHESIDCVKFHLSKFMGVSRRFEKIGKIYGCHVYDDYAHHPTEVRAVLQAAHQRFPDKTLLAVFQPHTYSRLVAMKDDFAAAFDDADQVVVTKVYAARETNDWSISGRDLAASIIRTPSENIPSLEYQNYHTSDIIQMSINSCTIRRSTLCIFAIVHIQSYVPLLFRQGDVVDRLVHQISKDPHREIVVLTLGAVDITTVGPKLLHELQNRIQNVNSWLASINSERLEFL